MVSLRDTLWLSLYGGEYPPANLVAKEIVISLVVAGLLFCLWWIIRRFFFLIVQRAGAARGTGLLFSISLAIAWLVGTLEPFEYRSFPIMIVLLFISLTGNLVYLFIKR